MGYTSDLGNYGGVETTEEEEKRGLEEQHQNDIVVIPQRSRFRKPVLIVVVCGIAVIAAAVALYAKYWNNPKQQQSSPKMLPPATQSWVHSATSLHKLQMALSQKNITAIETDLLMGYDITTDPNHTSHPIPITAHPPANESDLSVATLVKLTTVNGTLQKHLKLDLKELAVVGRTLDLVMQHPVHPNDKMVYLNADILPGPGNRQDANIEANAFLQVCLRHMDANQNGLEFAFSLGYKCDWHHETGFTTEDLNAMKSLVTKYNLFNRCAGLVLAINARLLSKDMIPFDAFLNEFPTTQILAWTGHGEPPIPQGTVDEIQQHFDSVGFGDAIGFDVQIEK